MKARERIAERLMGEILEYVFAEYLPHVTEEAWQRMGGIDHRMTMAIGRFERGEIEYAELEAMGVEYVEGWEGAVSAVDRSESPG